MRDAISVICIEATAENEMCTTRRKNAEPIRNKHWLCVSYKMFLHFI